MSAFDKITPSNGVVDYVEMYKEMTHSQRKSAQDRLEVPRTRRLEAKVDYMWPKLSREDKITALKVLAKDGYVPEEWVVAMEVFDGEIIPDNKRKDHGRLVDGDLVLRMGRIIAEK